MMATAADLIVLDTIGKLYAHGHGLSGYCRPCRRYFHVLMPVLIAARGTDSPVVGMRPLRRPGDGDPRRGAADGRLGLHG
jgi:hypothetical protein